MLEANEGLEKIFTNSVKEAEKRKHEYVTIEHVLLSLLKDKDIGNILIEFKSNVKYTPLFSLVGGAHYFNVFSQSITVDTALSAVSLWLPLIITKRFLGLPTILS